MRPIERVVVWDRDASAAKALAARLRAQNIDAATAPDLAKAVNDADIVSCATLATQPVVQGAWLRPRSHLDLIGSFTPQMREADDACFAGARLFVEYERSFAFATRIDGIKNGAKTSHQAQENRHAGAIARDCGQPD